jgi:hypothetical protein
MTKRSVIHLVVLCAGLGAMAVCAHPAGAQTSTTHEQSSSAPATRDKRRAPTTSKPGASRKSSPAHSSAHKSAGTKASVPKSAGTKSAGTVSAATKSAAGKSSGKTGKRAVKKSVGRQRGQMAPTPERISEIQQALAKNGAYTGTPSGKWDDSTADAMRKFQAAHGLNPSGKLDALTLYQLGLGSSTAGMAPPTPTVRTSSTALPADIQH